MIVADDTTDSPADPPFTQLNVVSKFSVPHVGSDTVRMPKKKKKKTFVWVSAERLVEARCDFTVVRLITTNIDRFVCANAVFP